MNSTNPTTPGEILLTDREALMLARAMSLSGEGFTDAELDAVGRWAQETRLRSLMLSMVLDGQLLIHWDTAAEQPRFRAAETDDYRRND